MYFSSERILMEVAVILLLREPACTCVTRGMTSVVPRYCITSYEMSEECVILVPYFVNTKPYIREYIPKIIIIKNTL
jgi:hypothetical protein